MQIHDQAGALRGRGQHTEQLQVLVELIDKLRPAAAPPRPGQHLVLGQLAQTRRSTTRQARSAAVATTTTSCRSWSSSSTGCGWRRRRCAAQAWPVPGAGPAGQDMQIHVHQAGA
ncbi:hypothetical protein A4F85_01210 [Delftia sp. GW456-R20]|uniref:hypothetical protein n=1 Tax=Delftia sp. GW456-R20 TaxID=1827145 RepID=UPI0007AE926B|nr:hypothetical protein [Delftia sp. GW456-R20]KZK32406.1 hypothetical protein A4F85_01210 [Delftia sp. GW456-R20]